MAVIRRFEDIISWQKARELNKTLGKYIDGGKFKSSYKLVSQIEGSAGSIMDNIAEGFERSGNREFLQFLYISKGSCGEFRNKAIIGLKKEGWKIITLWECNLKPANAEKTLFSLLKKLS
jgi:four helix bundle protein